MSRIQDNVVVGVVADEGVVVVVVVVAIEASEAVPTSNVVLASVDAAIEATVSVVDAANVFVEAEDIDIFISEVVKVLVAAVAVAVCVEDLVRVNVFVNVVLKVRVDVVVVGAVVVVTVVLVDVVIVVVAVVDVVFCVVLGVNVGAVEDPSTSLLVHRELS